MYMPPEEQKRASWLELFYDLAFVALVAQLTYLTASHHHSLTDALNVFIVGYAVFIAWWATTANRNMQDSETRTDKLLIQVQMVGAFLMSLTMPAVFVGEYVGFFVALALVRFMQVFMMIRMYRLHPESAPVTYNIVQGFSIAGILWLISAFVVDPYHYVLALAALAIDIMTPLSIGKGNKIRLLNIYHLQERLGLFLMLVMGESMIVVALSNTATTLSFFEPVIVFSGLLVMVSVWWLYFEHHDRWALGTRPKNFFQYLHAHGFLYGSIILLSVAYKELLSGDESVYTYGLLVGGLVGIVAALVVMRLALYGFVLRTCWPTVALIFTGMLVVFGGWYVGEVAIVAFVLAILLAVGAWFDTRVYAQLDLQAKL
jgi:low temperature requirement protein LtrA